MNRNDLSSGCPIHASVAEPVGPMPLSATWPPGPRSWPLGWGLITRMSRDLIGALSEWQQHFGDVVHLRIWPEHQVVVTDPALARELLLTNHEALIRWERGIRVFARSQGRSVLVSEGERWRNKRHALQPAFSPKSVQAFAPKIAATADLALREWPSAHEEWPVESALTSLTMEVIVQMMFSASVGMNARALEEAVHAVLVATDQEFYWPASWPDAMPWKRRKRRAQETLSEFIAGHVRARSVVAPDDHPDDLLTRLLTLHREDPVDWSLQAVSDECMTAFLAGHETVAATLTWWTWCMASNPDAQREAAKEVEQQLQGSLPAAQDLPRLQFLTHTLQETMRLYPAAPVLISRRCTRPVVLGAWRFPAGTMFMVPVQLMHQDSRWFADPAEFRPTRFGPGAPEVPRGAYLPFGAGPRVCLGQHLAMTEMTVVAALMLQRFVLARAEGEAAPAPVLNVTLRPKSPLHVRLSTRACAQEELQRARNAETLG